jgi:hypothetical protein
MIERFYWLNRIEKAWQEAPVVWLAGVRRSGKTTLALSLGEERSLYINCDLPAVAEMVADPKLFYENCNRRIIVFDEVHQLKDPSRLLKICADLFPNLKILATGSSTLAASRKFKDTLTGRKRVVHLTPVLWDELSSFNHAPLLKRLYFGGLPQTLLADTKMPGFYREWIDSFFARDVQRLFAFRNPDRFITVFEYVMRQSGGLLETASVSRSLGISRPTVEAYLRALETMHAITLLRPFYGGGQKELIKMPKAYGFDTGFVSFCRGWDPLRPDDYGILWEHVVLEYLQAHAHPWKVQYWKDAASREIDFVIARNRDEVDAIECKWDPARFDATSLKVFRTYYPKGNNFLVCPLTVPSYQKKIGDLTVSVCTPDAL